MPDGVKREIYGILTRTVNVFPIDVIDDVIENIQAEINLAFAHENPNYATPQDVLYDYFIPASYLWAFCMDI